MHRLNPTHRVLFLIAVMGTVFLSCWVPTGQGAPQTYFYGTANINAPFAIHNFAMDNRSVNDALPMFLNKGRAVAAGPAKATIPGTKTTGIAKDAHGKDKTDSEKGAEKDYDDYGDK